MKFSDVMGFYDYKISNIMRALGVSRTAVDSWKKKNKIPFKMQCLIQVVTKNELVANMEDWERKEIDE